MKTLTVKFRANAYGGSYDADCNDVYNSPTAKSYDYIYDGGREVNVGDLAVVKPGKEGFKIVKIVGVTEGKTSKAEQYAIDVVDLSAHRARETVRIRKAAIVKELEAEAKKVLDAMHFRVLAAQSPTIAKLLAELDDLQ